MKATAEQRAKALEGILVKAAQEYRGVSGASGIVFMLTCLGLWRRDLRAIHAPAARNLFKIMGDMCDPDITAKDMHKLDKRLRAAVERMVEAAEQHNARTQAAPANVKEDDNGNRQEDAATQGS